MHRKLLIVDDSPFIVDTMKIMLEDSAMQVVSAGDGEQALACIRGGYRPDLVITDLNMPQMGGLDLVRALKAMLPGTPVLVMSVDRRRFLREEARRLGVAGWIPKPVGLPSLISAIERVVSPRGTH